MFLGNREYDLGYVHVVTESWSLAFGISVTTAKAPPRQLLPRPKKCSPDQAGKLADIPASPSVILPAPGDLPSFAAILLQFESLPPVCKSERHLSSLDIHLKQGPP